MADTFLEWLSSNTRVTYPFREDSTLRDDTDSITIPPDLFIDFSAVGPPADSRYFISSIRVTVSGIVQVLEIDISNQLATLIATINVTTSPSLVRTVDSVTGIDAGLVLFKM